MIKRIEASVESNCGIVKTGAVSRGFRPRIGRWSALLLAVGSAAIACAPSPVPAQELPQSTPQASGFCNNDEKIPVLGTDKTITRGEYIKTLEGLLREKDPFVGGRSLESRMKGLGFTMGTIEQNCPGVTFEAEAQSNRDGSIRRLRPVPPSSPAHDVHIPQFNVNQGWWYMSYGLLSVIDDKTGERTYFSLAEPWQPAPGVEWPTFIREGDEYPHPFSRYTQPVYPFPTANSPSLYPSYTKDGARDWGKGVISPNLADQGRFNTPK